MSLLAERLEALVRDPDPFVGKSQTIRLIDIFVLAPAMVYVGVSGKVPRWMRVFAVLGGFATVYYNGVNYLRHERASR